MRYMISVILPFLSVCATLRAQTPDSSLTTDDLRLFGILLERIASPDLSTTIIEVEKRALASQFGLSQAEVTIVNMAAQRFRVTLEGLKQSEKALVSGKSDLSSSDKAALAALVSAKDRAIATEASGIAKSINASTLTRIRGQARVLAELLAAKGAK